MGDVVVFIRKEEVARLTHEDFKERGLLFDPEKNYYRGYRELLAEAVTGVRVLHAGDIISEEERFGGHNAYVRAAGDVQVFASTRKKRNGEGDCRTVTHEDFHVVHEHASTASRK